MSLSLQTTISRHPDMLSAEIGGEAVMMSIENGAYFGLNPVATRIWDLIASPQSLQMLVQTIQDEYEVSPEQCERDVQGFVADMLEKGLAQAA